MSNKVRVTLDLPEPFHARLETLCNQVHNTKSGVIRHSLQLFEHLVRRIGQGDELVLRRPDGSEKTLLLLVPEEPEVE